MLIFMVFVCRVVFFVYFLPGVVFFPFDFSLFFPGQNNLTYKMVPKQWADRV